MYSPILSLWTLAIRIHKAGCHTAALTGCGGRVKCRCRGGGRISSPVPSEMLAWTGFSRACGHGRVLFDISWVILFGITIYAIDHNILFDQNVPRNS